MSRTQIPTHFNGPRVFVMTGALLGLTLSACAQAGPRIMTAVKGSALVTLKGNTLPVATSLNDRGRLSDETPTGRLLLVLKHSDEQQAALDNLIAAQNTPGSSSFHSWLTPHAVRQPVRRIRR